MDWDWIAFGTWLAVAYCAAFAFTGAALALRRYRRAAPLSVAAALFFASVGTVTAQKGGGTNEPPRLAARPVRAAAQTPRGVSAAPAKVAKINARGAWRDSFLLEFGDGFLFPFGTNRLSFVEIITQGYARPRRRSAEFVADTGLRMAIVPGVSSLAAELTPSNSWRVVWTDAAERRDTNALVSASIEFMRNGDVAVTTNGVTRTIPRELPFPHDGFGQDGEWVAANFTNATEIAAAGGYAQWVDAQVGSGLTNGLYKFTVTIADTPPETVQLVVGDFSVAVTNAGEYVFLLEKGTRHAVGFSSLPDGVGYTWDDGEEAAQNAPLMLRGAVNSPIYAVRLISSGDDGNGVAFVEPSQGADGWIVWCPWMTVSPESVEDPVFPVLLVAMVHDIPLAAPLSITWRAGESTLATGDSFLWYGDEEDVDSISIDVSFRDVELHGSVSVERHVRQSEIAIDGGGLIVLEDGYTNAPNDVVAASSTSSDIRLSWALAQDGTFNLDSDCAASVSLATEGGSPASLPLEWHGCRDDEGAMTLCATGLGTGASGVLTFTFTPDEGGAPLSRTIPLQVVKIRVEAAADWPSNKVRHVFGPKEVFSITTNPQLQLCVDEGSLADVSGTTVTAPDRSGDFEVCVSNGTQTHQISFTCVAPSALLGGNPREWNEYEWIVNVGDPFEPGEAGVAMHIDTWLVPSYVSFRHLRIFEGFAPTINRTGWYLDAEEFPEELIHHGNNAGAGSGSMFQSSGICSFGNFTESGDCVAAFIGSRSAYSNGSYQVAIPLRWFAVGGEVTNSLPINLQSMWVYSNGTMRVQKNGVTWERSLDGVSHQVIE